MIAQARADGIELLFEHGRIRLLLEDLLAHGEGVAGDRDAEGPRRRRCRVLRSAKARTVGAIGSTSEHAACVRRRQLEGCDQDHDARLVVSGDTAAFVALYPALAALPLPRGWLLILSCSPSGPLVFLCERI